MFPFALFLILLIAFPIYYIIPVKNRYVCLFVASYTFYALQGWEWLVHLVLITLVTYCVALLMEKKKSKAYLCVGVVSLTLIMMFYKFSSIIGHNVSKDFNYVAPIGIMFYSLAAIGYIVDVYNEKVRAEQNFVKYALFISFFPVVISGPIERSTNLLRQINEEIYFSYEKVRRGLLCILCGAFLKLFIADELAIVVDSAYSSYYDQTGATMMTAVVLFGIQLYVDFFSYSIMAVGVGNLFGYSVIDNFRRPYLSREIKEFWSRWHISLSSWLRDYVYIPLGGNRKGRIRKYVNLIITFIISGLWHGNGLNYLVWGMLHGVYQVLADCLAPFKKRCYSLSKIRTHCFSFRLLEACITFVLVDFAWLFFRAPSLKVSILILKKIVSEFELVQTITSKAYLMGYNMCGFYIRLLFVVILLIFEIIEERKFDVSEWFFSQNKYFRWGIYVMLNVFVIVGVIRSMGGDASTFIYAQF